MSFSKVRKIFSDFIRRFKIFFKHEMEWQPSDEEVERLSRLNTFFMAFFYQNALFAIVVGFTVQSLFKFMNPAYLFIAGFFLAVSISCTYRLLVVSSVNKCINRVRLVILAITMFTISIALITYISFDAIVSSENHDQFCRNLQILVLHEINGEKNSTIFNNMQCRIQNLTR